MNKLGWVKIYRNLEDKGYYTKSQYVHLWVHILLKVNHKAAEFMWNNEIVIVNPGQFITGRKELSKATGIKESTIERILKCFENGHQIKQKKTNKCRMITALNWSIHQREDNERTTSGQRTDTNKNDKNKKNDKNILLANANSTSVNNRNKTSSKSVDLTDLYNSFTPSAKNIPITNEWQAEASNAIELLETKDDLKSSVYKCFRDDQHSARFAINDCKEFGKFNTLYFLKIYNDLNKK